MAAQLAGMGAPPELLAQLQAQAADDEAFEVWAENKDAVVLFLALSTQWRRDSGARTGLDYAAIGPAARYSRIRMTPELFHDLQVMEASAIEATGKRLAEDLDRRRPAASARSRSPGRR